MASALLGSPVVRLAYGAGPGRLNQLRLLDRIGRIEELGMPHVRFTDGSATVGSIASGTQPLSADGDRTRLIAASSYAPAGSSRSDTDGRPRRRRRVAGWHDENRMARNQAVQAAEPGNRRPRHRRDDPLK